MSVTLYQVIVHVCGRMEIPVSVLLSPSREQQYSRVRSAIMIVAHRRLHLTKSHIGRKMGGRHRSSIRHGIGIGTEHLRRKCPLTLRAYKLAARFVAAQRKAETVRLPDNFKESADDPPHY